MSHHRDQRGETLLSLARQAIEERFTGEPVVKPDLPWLYEERATFVTLTDRGQLRGCIGSLEPSRPLYDDVIANARAAAFRDPRFPPVRQEELGEMEIEVSVLSPIVPFPVSSKADLIERLRPGRDGVVLQLGERRATFLPSVWEQLPDPRDFLAHLERKAGLPGGFWSDEIEVLTYTVEKFGGTGP